MALGLRLFGLLGRRNPGLREPPPDIHGWLGALSQVQQVHAESSSELAAAQLTSTVNSVFPLLSPDYIYGRFPAKEKDDMEELLHIAEYLRVNGWDLAARMIAFRAMTKSHLSRGVDGWQQQLLVTRRGTFDGGEQVPVRPRFRGPVSLPRATGGP